MLGLQICAVTLLSWQGQRTAVCWGPSSLGQISHQAASLLRSQSLSLLLLSPPPWDQTETFLTPRKPSALVTFLVAAGKKRQKQLKAGGQYFGSQIQGTSHCEETGVEAGLEEAAGHLLALVRKWSFLLSPDP